MKVNIGIEKECLVFDQELQPVDLDINNLPSELTVDFANHQLEIVGDIKPGTYCTDVYLNHILSHPYLADKSLWPLSTPLASNTNVRHDKVDGNYRNYLADKYGIDKMLYSGIHFNYSNEKLVSEEEYFELMKKVYVFMPLILQFTSFSPVSHHDEQGLKPMFKDFGLDDSLSLRASDRYGFVNDPRLQLDFTSVDNYKSSLERAVVDGSLFDNRELYTKVRLKQQDANYIELRFLDLNPFVPSGISSEELVLLDSMLAYLTDYELCSEFNYSHVIEQIEQVALGGRNRELQVEIDGHVDSLVNHTNKLFTNIKQYVHGNTKVETLEGLAWKYNNQRLDIDVMCEELEKMTLMDFGRKYIHRKDQFSELYPQLKMELSTKIMIAEAEKRGYQVEVESESQNIIKVSNGEQSEYLIQATKTNLDKYANILLMNDKYMTKKILAEANVAVPTGIRLRKGDGLERCFDGDVVVKPLDTNFGQGITICDGSDKANLQSAIDYAFTFSDEILIEQFIAGEEYRLLVIGSEVVSVLTRKNANVIGDDNSTIAELIESKNQSSIRGTGYQKPLEKIIIDDNLVEVLAKQNYDLQTILACGQRAILRDTSNVSRGGDTHEVSLLIPDKYKQLAVKAAAALDVQICGVDMIIDLESDNYAIIECNYNPAIHIHTYPYSGRGVNVAAKVLDLLFEKE